MKENRWELADTSDSTNTGYVHHRTKLHWFDKDGYSACRKYWQQPGYYLEYIYDGQDEYFCKKCLKQAKQKM